MQQLRQVATALDDQKRRLLIVITIGFDCIVTGEICVLMETIRAWPIVALPFLRPGAAKKIRSVLVIEQRDEVFARLQADLALHGYSVQRAANPHEASAKFATTSVDLILANRELSTFESGWLLVSKWALGRKERRLWLYTAWPAAFDEHWMRFTRVKRLLYHGGNLWSLSECVLEELAGFDSSYVRRKQRASA